MLLSTQSDFAEVWYFFWFFQNCDFWLDKILLQDFGLTTMPVSVVVEEARFRVGLGYMFGRVRV